MHDRRRRLYGDPFKVQRVRDHAPTCAVPGCSDSYWAKGYCAAHGTRMERYGDPLAGQPPRPRGTPEERFWAKVQIGTDEECWPWLRCLQPSGYGDSELGLAHRVAYEFKFGPVPDGLDLDHMCHNADPTCPGSRACLHRRCCNSAHLLPATRSENMLRAYARLEKPLCTEGCGRKVHARGWCISHYMVWWREMARYGPE